MADWASMLARLMSLSVVVPIVVRPAHHSRVSRHFRIYQLRAAAAAEPRAELVQFLESHAISDSLSRDSRCLMLAGTK